MTDYIIQSGDTLSKIAKHYGVSVKQLQEANGIKNENLIFAGKTLKIPDLTDDGAFNIKGLSIENNNSIEPLYAYRPPKDGDDSGVKPLYAYFPPKDGDDSGVKPLYAYFPPKDGDDSGVKPMYAYFPPKDGDGSGVKPEYAYIPPKDGDGSGVKPEYAYIPPKDGDGSGVKPEYAYIPPKDGDGSGVKPEYAYIPPKDGDITPAPIVTPAPETPAKPPEDTAQKSWKDVISGKKEMVCRDASGKTANIQGRLNVLDDVFIGGSPDKFTITDNSSGQDHVYTYVKIGTNEEGKPIYRCTDMNGQEMEENQYTLEWVNDTHPELVQYDKQDNYGRGLKRKNN